MKTNTFSTHKSKAIVNFENAGQPITYAEAARLTANFTENIDGVQSLYFKELVFKTIFNNPDVYGVWFWVGHDKGRFTLLVIPCDYNGSKMLDSIFDCNQRIPKETAEDMTDFFSISHNGTRGYLHSRESINRVLKKSAGGIGVYVGKHSDGSSAIVLMPENWTEISNKNSLSIEQIAVTCPPICGD